MTREIIILPETIINLPRYGSINLHPSMLPKYRGTAPIQHAILNGDCETGVTIFKLNKQVDSGNIIIQEKYKIDDSIIFSDLYIELSEFGSKLLLEAINLIENNKVIYTSQRDILTSYTKKITTNDCRIDRNNSAESIHNKIRSLSYKPGAYTLFNKKYAECNENEIQE